MISLAVDYLNKTIPKLPNFYATRTTVRYEETPQYFDASTPVDYRPLHAAANSKATVFYSNGKEVVDSSGAKGKKRKAADGYLLTYGVFGPLLGAVTDAIASGLTWNRWEQGADAPHAVFVYQIPAEKSHYRVGGCCLPDGDGTSPFENTVGYHGEIAIDRAERRHPSPETGGRPESNHAACPVRHHDRIRPGGDRRQDLHLSCKKRLHFEREIRNSSNRMG